MNNEFESIKQGIKMSQEITELEDIIIDEEFMRLMPPLDEHEFCSLEDDILIHGCMNPLVLWNGILIDGHNRYKIVEKHNLPFKTISLEFDSRDEVISWMITIQIYRRNLTPMQLTYYRGLQYNIEKKLHGDIERVSQNSARGQNDPLQGHTANRLSEQYKISPRTIKRDGQIADVIIAIGKESEEAKRNILSGETRISRKQLRDMSSDSEDKLAKTALEIEAGTFEEKNKLESGSSGDTSSVNSGNAASFPLSADIIAEANEFVNSLQKMPQNTTPDKLKKTIRSFIENLEEIYKKI